METGATRGINRRGFVGLLGLAGAGAVGTGLAPERAGRAADIEAADAVAGTDAHGGHGQTAAQSTTNARQEPTADEMDAMHEAGVKAFPQATAGLGGQPLAYVMDGGVKVFALTCQLAQWEYAAGQVVEAWTYNGAVPGPEIRVTEGDAVRVVVRNELPQSTAVHWHGLVVPNAMDGVPGITQPPIKPGGSFTYEFPIREGNAGTHMYHAHYNSAEQVVKGLLGAFIVEPKDPASRPAFDREYTLVLNDGPIGGFSLNGKSFPATRPLVAKRGERVLIRYMNEGMMIHPMHLHGLPMRVVAQDGYLLPQAYTCDTLNIAPGQRFEAIVAATEPGTWAFHCHVLTHAEGPHGMFGMVTALVVEE
jgi:FtsP/CotA-like multicopper oxidase with cupredoxin domain